MKMMISTLKWDLISHIMFFRIAFFVYLAAVILFIILPTEALWAVDMVPDAIPEIMSIGNTILHVALLGGAGYLFYIHPLISPIYDIHYYGLSERMPNRPFAMIMAGKLFCNIVVVTISIVISYLLHFHFDIGNVVPFGFDAIPALLFAVFTFALFVPMSIVYIYFLIAVGKSLGIPTIIGLFIIPFVQVANIFFFNRFFPTTGRTIEVVLFFIMFIAACWLYDRKLA